MFDYNFKLEKITLADYRIVKIIQNENYVAKVKKIFKLPNDKTYTNNIIDVLLITTFVQLLDGFFICKKCINITQSNNKS